MGARSVVERAFQSALLRVGFDGLRQAARCRAELTRFCSEHSSAVTHAVALASTAAGVLDTCSDGRGPTDSSALAELLESQGLPGADARWVGLLWAPVLAHLQDVRAIDARWEPPERLGSSSEALWVDHLNLRPQLTEFLGRQRDIAVLDELLTRARLVTLVGPGGVGKTRLALEVAGRLAGRYPDGVWTAELAPVGPDTDVVEAIASSLGVKQRGAATTTRAVVDWLAPRSALVVLDNCEHLMGPVRGFVDDVLQQCPWVGFLLTSREALGLPGEHRWFTEPLAVPPEEAVDVADAMDYEAIELFMARSCAVAPGFTLSAHNVGQITAICRRLDGMPLALELAAARIPALGPAELLEHLDQRFRLLKGPGAPSRHTLRGTVDWSYGLLDEAQRRLFRRLTVFAGGWSLNAGREVCSGDGLDPADVVDVLSELVAKSLVSTELTPGSTRYHMLETLRHYGQERLDEAGEGDAMRRRHAQWARLLVERVAPGLKGRDERVSGDLIHAELDNLRTAVHWAIGNDDPDIGFGIIAPLEDYAVLRLDFEVASWAEQLLAVRGWDDHPLRHVALGLLAHAAWARGDHERATELGEAALEAEARHGSVRSWVARQAVGDAAWFRGRTAEAMDLFARWVEETRRHGQDFDRSWALAHLAVAESVVGSSTTEHSVGDEALELARRCGSPFLIALALYAKSECVLDEDPELALARVEEGVAIGRNSGNRFAYGLCLSTFASLTGRLGEPAQALPLYRLAVQNWRDADNWTNQRILLRNLAEFAARIGEPELTARLLGALDASGEMLGAGSGPEGARLADAVRTARHSLGDELYDQLVRQGARVTPPVLVRETLNMLDQVIARAGTAARDGEPSRSAPAALSPREREVVALLSTGLTNRQIGARLFISERTVDTHISRIRRKLGTTTRTQLALWGLEHSVP